MLTATFTPPYPPPPSPFPLPEGSICVMFPIDKELPSPFCPRLLFPSDDPDSYTSLTNPQGLRGGARPGMYVNTKPRLHGKKKKKTSQGCHTDLDRVIGHAHTSVSHVHHRPFHGILFQPSWPFFFFSRTRMTTDANDLFSLLTKANQLVPNQATN